MSQGPLASVLLPWWCHLNREGVDLGFCCCFRAQVCSPTAKMSVSRELGLAAFWCSLTSVRQPAAWDWKGMTSPLCVQTRGLPLWGTTQQLCAGGTGQSLICKLWLRCPSAGTLATYSGSRFILTRTPPTPCSVGVVKLPCWLALQTLKRPPLSCMATVALTPEKRARLLLPRDLRLTCPVASGIFSASGGMDP